MSKRPEPRGPDPTWIAPKDNISLFLERFMFGFIALVLLGLLVAVTLAWVWSIPALAVFVAACWLIGRLVIRE